MAFLTRTELLASYAPNATENITAITHQNWVESAMVYGALDSDGYTTTVGVVAERLEFDTVVYGYGMTAGAVGGLPNGGTYDNFANFQLGHYIMNLNVDAQLDTNTYTFQLYGAADTPVGGGLVWNAKDAGERVLLQFTVPADIVSDVSDLSVRVSANKNAETTFNGINWIMHRIGSD